MPFSRLLFLSATLLLGLSLAVSAQTKSITLEDIWEKGTFQAKGGPRGVHFLNDGKHYSTQKGSAIEKVDLVTGQTTATLFNAANIASDAPNWKKSMDSYTFSADEQYLLLATNETSIYRWSTEADYYMAGVKGSTCALLYDQAKQRYPTFSPKADHVAFVAKNNLFVKNLATGDLTQITQDGQTNAIINGASDWCYEEEFELVRAFEWSPDGSKIAFLRFDESAIPEMVMERYTNKEYPELETFKYPKVGERNSTVTAFIYDLKTRAILPVETTADPEDYFPRLAWTPKGDLCLTRMNRHQNHLWLLLADAKTGKCATLLEESNAAYIDLHEPHFLQNGTGFVWQTEKSGFNHLYFYDMKGKEKMALTKGNFDVTAFYGVDEKNGLVYYQAAAVSPMQREVYAINLKGKKGKRISGEPGYHSANFTTSFDYYINTVSNLNAPPRYAVCDREGKMVRALEQNEELRQKQQEYGTVAAEFIQIPLNYTKEIAGGPWQGHLNGFVMKPANLQPGTKLPLLMFVYGGPGSQQAVDQWKGGNYWWFQMLVQQGYAVACVDNRGTGARGEQFKKCTYMQLGHLETIDQIAAARHLGTLDFVDAARIGIFGWSYGGYMSSLCLFKGNDVFKAAIAVAPVTNWKWYDSIYTERYMRTHKENEKGYEDNSPINFADRLTGNYMLVHGLTDDNVHFQHSAEMSNRLIAANKQFEAMLYPNRNHGIGDRAARLHLYRKMTMFLENKLKK
jgi:dipeptidyl-peptidase 4